MLSYLSFSHLFNLSLFLYIEYIPNLVVIFCDSSHFSFGSHPTWRIRNFLCAHRCSHLQHSFSHTPYITVMPQVYYREILCCHFLFSCLLTILLKRATSFTVCMGEGSGSGRTLTRRQSKKKNKNYAQHALLQNSVERSGQQQCMKVFSCSLYCRKSNSHFHLSSSAVLGVGRSTMK